MLYECKKDWIMGGVVYFKKGEHYEGEVTKDRLGEKLTVVKEEEYFPISFYKGSEYFEF